MALRSVIVSLSCAALLLAAGCPGPSDADPVDGGDTGRNPLPTLRDGGLSRPSDGGTDKHDGGQAPEDAGQQPDDAGPPPVDAGSPPDDGGTPPPDDAGVDAGPPPEFIAQRGEPCYVEGGTGCADGLVCVSIFTSGAGTCEYPCDVEGEACVTGGTCTDFGAQGAPELACAAQVADGAACSPEQLIVCAGEGVCLANELEPLGGTCRTPCTCASGTSCAAAACGAGTCVVVDPADGSGFCGTAVPVGGACSPIEGGAFCEGTATGAATCILEVDTPGSGVCRQRCDDAADCSGLPDGAQCVGMAPDGLCLPTTNLQQGDLCTLAGTTPTLACQTGLDCFGVHADLPTGYGVCLRDCAANGDAACGAGESCFALPADQYPGAGDRCLTELPRGTHGCDPPEPLCEGDGDKRNGICVELADDSICKHSCTLAECPNGNCECGVGETCVSSYLASPELGVCGQEVGLGESCDEDRDIYCAAAPGQDIDGNAFAACVDRCVWVCHYEPAGAPAVDLACPAGYECRQDPTGRLVSTVRICVAPGM